jgi:ethanolamine transporter
VILVLIGIFPVLDLIIRLLRNPLGALGRLIGIDAVSTGGLLFTLANSVPVYSLVKDMNKKGKIINIAWIVPATAALGDHLGFTAGVNAEMITPVIVGKLSAGICAIVLALIFTRNLRDTVPANAPEAK